jgi:pyruvate/2-oxoglutarate dehydrogenase complex dihydrolipoamide dehydrogenase (E3) component
LARPEFDIVVIGGGSAGLVVAAGAAQLGARVALVEKHELGGDCLHTGCVPSKTLIRSAKIAHLMRTAERYGIPSAEPAVRLADVMERVAAVISRVSRHDSPERFRGLGVDVVFGAGRFVDAAVFEVGGRRLAAKTFVIATGSRPAVPPIPGLDRVPFLTNESIFDLREDVPALAIIGAGPVGVEMAQAFARLGSRVTVIDVAAGLLPREDRDLAAVVETRLRNEGVDFRFATTITSVEGVSGSIRLGVRGNEGDAGEIVASHLLIAVGRRANVDGLALDAAGVAVDHGHVVVDTRLRTTNPRIFAAGDVTGGHLFTHVAGHHGGIVLRQALFRMFWSKPSAVVPWCTYTDPELARVGLSEDEARERRIDHRVYRFAFDDLDRAHTEGATDGHAKILTDPRGRLLGAAIVGAQAGELIHEYVLALQHGMKAADVAGPIHVYPTLAEINKRVAEQRLKAGLTPTSKAWIKRLLRLRGA